MSGALSSILSAVSDAISLYTGGTLTLGSMTFVAYEVPEKVSYGGQQQLTVHKLPGGARVIDNTGNDPHEISWSGIFLGAGAQSRRSQLDAIRLNGDPVELTFSDASFSVMVASCEFQEAFQKIEYRIACVVVPDTTGDDADTTDLGDGSTPTTPTQAADSGQSSMTSARAKAAAVKTTQPSGLGGTSFDVRLA